MTLLAFIIVFSILVFVHEFGHFLAAKKRGMTVHEFGFGFPPLLVSRVWRGTRYSLNLFPLGGFVRIKGEEGEDAGDRDSFSSRRLWERALVIVAGVTMNVLLGWFLLTTAFIVGAPQVVDDTVPERYVRHREVIVRSVLPRTPAAASDMKPGDTITAIDGVSVTTIRAMQEALVSRQGKETAITIQRKKEVLTRAVTPDYISEAKRVGLGVGLEEVGTVRYPFFIALGKGVVATGIVLREIVFAFYGLLRDLVVTQRVSIDLSGPIGIAVLTGEVARRGIASLVQFTALLSLNLAVLNILPIPALDGGRLLFLAIEKIRRKSLMKETEHRINQIGFVLLILLVLLVTYRDIAKLF